MAQEAQHKAEETEERARKLEEKAEKMLESGGNNLRGKQAGTQEDPDGILQGDAFPLTNFHSLAPNDSSGGTSSADGSASSISDQEVDAQAPEADLERPASV